MDGFVADMSAPVFRPEEMDSFYSTKQRDFSYAEQDSWSFDLPVHNDDRASTIVPQASQSQSLPQINYNLLGSTGPPQLFSEPVPGFLASVPQAPREDILAEGQLVAVESGLRDNIQIHPNEHSVSNDISEEFPAPKNQFQSPAEMRMKQPTDRITRRVQDSFSRILILKKKLTLIVTISSFLQKSRKLMCINSESRKRYLPARRIVEKYHQVLQKQHHQKLGGNP